MNIPRPRCALCSYNALAVSNQNIDRNVTHVIPDYFRPETSTLQKSIMHYTTLFAALSLLASSTVVTALPHGDHPPASLSLPAHRNTNMSMPKPTGTGSSHPPGCTCSHCMPHKSALYGNATSSSVPKHNCTSTMAENPAHSSFPVSSHTPKTKTIVVTSTMFDEPSYILFSSTPLPTATPTSLPNPLAMALDPSPSSPPALHPSSTSSPQNLPPLDIQIEDQKLGIGLAVGFLVLAILCIAFIFWRRSKGEFVYKWGQGWVVDREDEREGKGKVGKVDREERK